MKKLEAITTVYSYRFPEVRELITELTDPFPHDIFLKSIEPGLDDFHEPIIDKVVKFNSKSVPRLKDFKYRYPTSGSEGGIREFLTLLQSKGVRQIYVFKGEYEGYREVGKTRCIETIEVRLGTKPKYLKPGYWFISNPSACDGNIIPKEVIDEICDAGHKVFYDLAYLNSTRPHEFDLGHENIIASVISFSKPYGLFYDRVGFTFSKEEIPSLYANKWFKSILALLIAEKIVTELNPTEIHDKYRPVQEEIVKTVNEVHGLHMKPSDAILLGYLSRDDVKGLGQEKLEMIKRFQRGDSYRFCLTPHYLNRERYGTILRK